MAEETAPLLGIVLPSLLQLLVLIFIIARRGRLRCSYFLKNFETQKTISNNNNNKINDDDSSSDDNFDVYGNQTENDIMSSRVRINDKKEETLPIVVVLREEQEREEARVKINNHIAINIIKNADKDALLVDEEKNHIRKQEELVASTNIINNGEGFENVIISPSGTNNSIKYRRGVTAEVNVDYQDQNHHRNPDVDNEDEEERKQKNQPFYCPFENRKTTFIDAEQQVEGDDLTRSEVFETDAIPEEKSGNEIEQEPEESTIDNTFTFTTTTADNVDSSSEELHYTDGFDLHNDDDDDDDTSVVEIFAKALGADVNSKSNAIKYITTSSFHLGEAKLKEKADSTTETTNATPTSPIGGHPTSKMTMHNDYNEPRRAISKTKDEDDENVDSNTSVNTSNQDMLLINTSKKRPLEMDNGGTTPSTKKQRLVMTSSQAQSSFPNGPYDKMHEEQSDDYQSKLWYKMLQELIESKNNFEDNPSLIHWTANQRRQYDLRKKNKPSTMTDERIASLQQIGFVWNLQESVWDQRLSELKQVVDNGNIPSDFIFNPGLASWVDHQRVQYRLLSEDKPSTMSWDCIAKLESLGFKWDRCRLEESNANSSSQIPTTPNQKFAAPVPAASFPAHLANDPEKMNSQSTKDDDRDSLKSLEVKGEDQIPEIGSSGNGQKLSGNGSVPFEVKSEDQIPETLMSGNRKRDSQSESIPLEVKSEDQMPDTVVSGTGQRLNDSVRKSRENQTKSTTTMSTTKTTVTTRSSTSSKEKGGDDDDATLIDIFTAAAVASPDGGDAKTSSVVEEADIPLSNEEVIRYNTSETQLEISRMSSPQGVPTQSSTTTLFEVTVPAGKLGIGLTEKLVVCRIFPHFKLAGKILVGDKLVKVNGMDVERWSWGNFDRYVAETESQERICVFSRSFDLVRIPGMELKKTRSREDGGTSEEGTAIVESPPVCPAPQFQNGRPPRMYNSRDTAVAVAATAAIATPFPNPAQLQMGRSGVCNASAVAMQHAHLFENGRLSRMQNNQDMGAVATATTTETHMPNSVKPLLKRTDIGNASPSPFQCSEMIRLEQISQEQKQIRNFAAQHHATYYQTATPVGIPVEGQAARPVGKRMGGDGNNEPTNVSDVQGAKQKQGKSLVSRSPRRFKDDQSEAWTFRWEEAKQFRTEHGHCCIPCKYPANQPLATWAKRQRYQYVLFRGELVGGTMKGKTAGTNNSTSKWGRIENSSLTRERIQALNSIGFCWDTREFRWFIKYEEFKAIIVKFRSPRLNGRNTKKEYRSDLYKHINKTNPSLRTWLKCQQHQSKKWLLKKPSHMTAERARLLSSIGFDFRT